jgi:hypothetical protein
MPLILTITLTYTSTNYNDNYCPNLNTSTNPNPLVSIAKAIILEHASYTDQLALRREHRSLSENKPLHLWLGLWLGLEMLLVLELGLGLMAKPFFSSLILPLPLPIS